MVVDRPAGGGAHGYAVIRAGPQPATRVEAEEKNIVGGQSVAFGEVVDLYPDPTEREAGNAQRLAISHPDRAIVRLSDVGDAVGLESVGRGEPDPVSGVESKQALRTAHPYPALAVGEEAIEHGVRGGPPARAHARQFAVRSHSS